MLSWSFNFTWTTLNMASFLISGWTLSSNTQLLLSTLHTCWSLLCRCSHNQVTNRWYEKSVQDLWLYSTSKWMNTIRLTQPILQSAVSRISGRKKKIINKLLRFSQEASFIRKLYKSSCCLYSMLCYPWDKIGMK